MRTFKTVNGVQTEFFWNGSQLLAQKTGNEVYWFLYDANGTRLGIKVQSTNTAYYYMYNVQGDVIGLCTYTGQVVGTYSYSDYGEVLAVSNVGSNTIASLNPFRFKGYYYDSETGLYYVSSRYYDPETCRWINADKTENLLIDQNSLVQYNLFAYCLNNPVNMVDPTGEIAILTCVLIGAGIGLLLGGATGAYISYKKFNQVRWKYVLIGAVAGAAIGAAAGYAIGIAIGASTTTIGAAKGFANAFKITSKIIKQMARRG